MSSSSGFAHRAAALLLLLASCSRPASVTVGELRIENQLDRPVAAAAHWVEAGVQQHASLQVLVPRHGAEMSIEHEEPLPKGTRFLFALEGPGFDTLVTRGDELAGDFLGAVLDVAVPADGEERQIEREAGFVRLSRRSWERAGDALEGAALDWTYPGGPVHIVLTADGAGGLRVVER